MKKLLALLLTAAFLIGALGACGSDGSDMNDYRALMREMTALTEYRFVGDVTITLGSAFRPMPEFVFADAMPARFRVHGTVSHANREMFASYVYETALGEQIFDLNMVLRERVMYLGLSGVLEYILRPMLESLERETAEFQIEDIVGEDAFLLIPHEAALSEMLFIPPELGSNVNFEPFLTRDGERFTITLEGEDVRLAADDISLVLAQFMVQDDFVRHGPRDLLGDMSRRLDGAELANARVLMITSRSGNTFYQTIELRVDDLIDMRANFTFIREIIEPIGELLHVLTEDELSAQLLAFDWNELFPEIDSVIDSEEDAERVRLDLDSLELINPALTEPSLLYLAELGTAQAGEVLDAVAVIRGADVTGGDFHLTVETGVIGMIYTLLDGRNAAETVLAAMAYDQVGTFLSDSKISTSVLRTNEAHSMAAMAAAEETALGTTTLYIYLAQSIEEDTVLRLELVFHLDHFSAADHEIVTELSQQFGINLAAYITELLSGL